MRIRPRAPRAMTMVWGIIMMTALLAIVSLGVDLGRVQLAKTELQRAADAAARYAASSLPSGIAAVQSAALDAADDNLVDGSPLVLNSSADVEFGTWNSQAKTFTVLSGSARNSANAIRITARRTSARGNAVPLLFAQIIGRTECDVSATTIALTNANKLSFVGLNFFDTGSNSIGRSYDSSVGTPGGANLASNATIVSNTEIEIGNNCAVNGNLIRGPNGSFDLGSNFTLSGSQYSMVSDLSFPATETPTVSSMGAVNIPTGTVYTAPAGTYNLSNITGGNNCTISFSGPVVIYVTGYAALGNGAVFNAYQNRPSNLKIRMLGTSSFSMGNSCNFTAEFYGPSNRLNAGTTFQFNGSAVAGSLTTGNNATFNYDETLNSLGSAGVGIAVVK